MELQQVNKEFDFLIAVGQLICGSSLIYFLITIVL
jgi:uncharacterized protein (UPF0333 family)